MTLQELFDKPEKWTRMWYARDAYGTETTATAEDAVCWCLLGGLRLCYGEGTEQEDASARLTRAIAKRDGRGLIWYWQDTPGRTFEEVLEVIREANV